MTRAMAPLILVVDDDPTARLLYRTTFERIGYDVLEADDGGPAVLLFEANEPDIVVLDLAMGLMDGIETCRRIRRLEAGRDTPILVVTGTGDDAAVEQAYAAGVTDFVTKPVNWTVLAQRIRYMHRARDVAREYRSAQQSLLRAQKMEAIGQIAGGVAHDFNNLLGVIVANIELARDQGGMAPGQQALLDEAIAAAEHGGRLTQRLLAFARRQPLWPQPVDVNALVVGMQPLLRQLMGDAIRLELALDDALRRAHADPGQLESAVLNLALNARDAMPNGGRLRIVSRPARLGRGDLAGADDLAPGDYVCLAVEDTGVGIPAEIQEQVFEPFFTTKGPTQGGGLGLSMVLGFVKQSGGHVRLDSVAGRGTTVLLYLPAAAAAAAPAAEPRVGGGSRGPHQGGGETILLVEDNAGLRDLMVVTLTTLGYRPLAAEDARSALALLAAHPEIALVLSDIVLPDDVSGFELVRRARETRPDLPVLFTSGFVDPSAARDSGFADATILEKPVRRGVLADKLRALLAPRAGEG